MADRLLNGRLVNACLVLAPEIEGQEVTTVEGLAGWQGLHPVQQDFAGSSRDRTCRIKNDILDRGNVAEPNRAIVTLGEARCCSFRVHTNASQTPV